MALRIEKVSKLSQKAALDLFKLSLCGSSVSQQFYGYLLCNDKRYTCITLAIRIVKFCAENNINVTKYKTYANNVKYRLKRHLWGTDGVVNSILTLTNNYSKQNRHVLNLLLKSF